MYTASYSVPLEGKSGFSSHAARDLKGWYLFLELTTAAPMEWMDLSYSAGGQTCTMRLNWEGAS